MDEDKLVIHMAEIIKTGQHGGKQTREDEEVRQYEVNTDRGIAAEDLFVLSVLKSVDIVYILSVCVHPHNAI